MILGDVADGASGCPQAGALPAGITASLDNERSRATG